MSIDEILEEMDELLDKAGSVPFVSHKKVIDGERMRELINDVRLNMPHELKEAKKIEFDCQRILNEAKLNAESIIRKAEERAAQIVSREAIVTEAKKKALDMLTKAQTAAKNLQQNAATSVAKMLNDTESYYSRNLQSIKVVKSKLGSNLSSGLGMNDMNDKKNGLQ
ncbi:MAG: vacuolar-type H+-ATPase subunit H [Ruminococcus sp.]|jgi:vacuolar-type H+-ATPase subunit H|uniref:vacuolar-type H+-ATPase subunit H n=1 Tax=Ruminococcus sp. TaxID=41978 RepID=UPI001B239719|nr:vacuolar-type H+-ATPase subunit H [Ruminococcus sp.]MBO7473989.1 vacuolar-type H+-ATPase subunit H [Ruminococcus sp.]MBP5431222.1 vacuolar-type H+-ATPase subunit H [Ruminococcus sp.]